MYISDESTPNRTMYYFCQNTTCFDDLPLLGNDLLLVNDLSTINLLIKPWFVINCGTGADDIYETL